MSLIEDLEQRAQNARLHCADLRNAIATYEQKIVGLREQLEAAELEGVESMAGASVLRNVGFRAYRPAGGDPTVEVDPEKVEALA